MNKNESVTFSIMSAPISFLGYVQDAAGKMWRMMTSNGQVQVQLPVASKKVAHFAPKELFSVYAVTANGRMLSRLPFLPN